MQSSQPEALPSAGGLGARHPYVSFGLPADEQQAGNADDI
jgi:hypothetical protein